MPPLAALILIIIAFIFQIISLIMKGFKARFLGRVMQLCACGFFIAFSSIYIKDVFKSDAGTLDIANFILFLFSISLFIYEMVSFVGQRFK